MDANNVPLVPWIDDSYYHQKDKRFQTNRPFFVGGVSAGRAHEYHLEILKMKAMGLIFTQPNLYSLTKKTPKYEAKCKLYTAVTKLQNSVLSIDFVQQGQKTALHCTKSMEVVDF